ncbi:MAG TPA: LytTR family DNA-binding domain-containing protein [Puia sp.]|uniref:LytR/AlgR family response regulator transcription factor n=1 Tax=Puia sp. TaxID=2045100 RepID=UPI002B56CC76|nr:LytTR family DNA-binding domain-containing protein [Puia sp.]HVU96483.1 LytTR family DNA-binding domain-containing protein [Puia sp.]
MIRTILVDDEIDSIRVLSRLLETFCPKVSIVGTANGVDTAADIIRETRPDLVLLDIEMSQGNAFDLLNRLMPLEFQVIFVTAFDSYAIRAFKYSAVDYLLKPVDIDDLRSAIDRVREKPQTNDLVEQMRILLSNVGMLQVSHQKMAIPTITGLNFVPVQDILRFEAKGSYTVIYLSNGETVMATRTLREYEDLLPENVFCRIHSSHIINLSRIEKYQKGRGGVVLMEDGTTIEVAARRRDEFMRRLLK